MTHWVGMLAAKQLLGKIRHLIGGRSVEVHISGIRTRASVPRWRITLEILRVERVLLVRPCTTAEAGLRKRLRTVVYFGSELPGSPSPRAGCAPIR